MKIENLSKDLDAGSMSAVRGGDAGNSATNTIGQVTNLCAPAAAQATPPAPVTPAPATAPEDRGKSPILYIIGALVAVIVAFAIGRRGRK